MAVRSRPPNLEATRACKDSRDRQLGSAQTTWMKISEDLDQMKLLVTVPRGVTDRHARRSTDRMNRDEIDQPTCVTPRYKCIVVTST